jgi:hypothetical protein
MLCDNPPSRVRSLVPMTILTKNLKKIPWMIERMVLGVAFPSVDVCLPFRTIGQGEHVLPEVRRGPRVVYGPCGDSHERVEHRKVNKGQAN